MLEYNTVPVRIIVVVRIECGKRCREIDEEMVIIA